MKVKQLSIFLCLIFALSLFPAVGTAEASVSVTASAAVVMDYDTGEILYGKDIDTLRVPASMTKIMTAYIIYEEMAKGNLSKSTQVRISSAAASMSRNNNYPMAVPLTSGGYYSVDTLLRLIMVPSASASCYAMAEHISGSEAAFVSRMNSTASALGINASFSNCHGAQVHYISARGVATLIRTFIRKYPDILNYTSLQSVIFNGVTYSNTNRLLSDYYYQGADGFKTGTITASGYCLSATAKRNGRRIISVVMNSSSTAARHTDSQKLLDYGFAEVAKRDAARGATQASFSSVPGSLRLNDDFEATVKLSGVSTEYLAAGGGWTVNGTVVKTFGAFTASNNTTFTLTGQYLPADYTSGSATIGFYITQYNGARVENTVTIPVGGEPPAYYRDVSGHWAEGVIEALSDNGLMNGVGSGYFGTDVSMTRAQFVTVLGRLANMMGENTAGYSTSFGDVQSGTWYTEYVAWAAANNIVEGYNSQTFGVGDSITREQMMVLLVRFADYMGIPLTEDESTVPGEDESTVPDEDESTVPDEDSIAGSGGEDILSIFADRESVSDWAREAVAIAVESGLVEGYEDGSIRPQGTASRAEVAMVFYRFINAYVNVQP